MITLVANNFLYLLLFLFPLFFLTTTQEFFSTNKLYLVAFGSLILLIFTVLKIAVDRTITWQRHIFDNAVSLFFVAVGISVIITTPNKIAALLSPNFGLVLFGSLTILYFYLSRMPAIKEKASLPLQFINWAAIVAGLVAIVFFFQPFKNATLPTFLQFLKNPTFNTLGSEIDLLIFLGFAMILNIVNLVKREHHQTQQQFVVSIVAGLFSTVGLLLMAYTVFSPLLKNSQTAFAAAPYRLSWYAAVEILKQPLTALFGAGVFNFSALFTLVKDAIYNQTPLWQVQTFNFSRSTFLHILTETGLVGIVSFGLLVYALISKIIIDKKAAHGIPLVERILTIYVLLMMLLFPPSITIFFLFYVMVAQIARRLTAEETGIFHHPHVTTFNLATLLPVYLLLLLLSSGGIIAAGYFLGRSYVAEYYFRRSLDGYANNSAAEVYNNQRQAIMMNPYIERFRINFAQTNLLIANNLAQRIQEQAKADPKAKVNEQDRQTIAQAIQAAIQESKAAVTLNPQRASNWENLAVIYRNVLNIAQGADVWTISSYQRAIVLDPRNPIYRLNLGGVYFSMGNYDEASKLFEQTVSLKPDWSNAYYNLAWASYQKGDYQRAAAAMQNVISLLDPTKDGEDYKKAQQNLEEFKAKIPKQEEKTQSSTQSGKLAIPTPPKTQISPKIELPEDSSPPSPPPGTQNPPEATSEGTTNTVPTVTPTTVPGGP